MGKSQRGYHWSLRSDCRRKDLPVTAAGGIASTVCRLADQIIVELNGAHSKNMMGMHDVYEPLDPPYRREIPIYKPSDRIGLPYIRLIEKIIGVVEVNKPDRSGSFADADRWRTKSVRM